MESLQTEAFDKPWLLNFFDQIRFYEVSHSELQQIRRDFPQGRYPIEIEESNFSLSEYQAFIESNHDAIAQTQTHRQAAFDEELANWHRTGQFNYVAAEVVETSDEVEIPENAIRVDSSVSGSVWQSTVTAGQQVKTGDLLLVLESMKMEINISSPCDGVVTQILRPEGSRVQAGQVLVIIEALK